MLREFYELGHALALSEAEVGKPDLTKLSWVSPVIGGLAGAAIAPLVLPALGSDNRMANPVLGALIGAGLGSGVGETIRATATLAEPRLGAELSANIRKTRQIIKELQARRAAKAAEAIAPSASSPVARLA